MADSDAPRRRRWRSAILIVVAVVALVAVGGWFAYRNLSGNIETIDPAAGLGDVRPAKENQSLNILAIGSDSREGANSVVGGDSPGLADTTLVMHLAADDSWAAAVSIPRDSMVEMPDCVGPDGEVVPGDFRQFNAAFPIGGPVCVQRTVESLTDLRIDHFVVIDFTGFQDMVDAIGGVTVYVEEPISDPRSKIYFDPGCQVLDGTKSLDYVRVRHGVGAGDGSDLGRIERQQAFLSSLAQKVTSSGVLFNPIDLYQFLDAATQSITTDTGLGSVRALASVAVRVRGVGLGNVDFTTVPNEPWPVDPNRVIWSQPEADELWAHLREDVPLTPVAAEPSTSADPSRAGSATPSAAASPSASGQSPSAPGSASPSPTTSFDTGSADRPICPTP